MKSTIKTEKENPKTIFFGQRLIQRMFGSEKTNTHKKKTHTQKNTHAKHTHTQKTTNDNKKKCIWL